MNLSEPNFIVKTLIQLDCTSKLGQTTKKFNYILLLTFYSLSLFEIFNLELINFYISNTNITYHCIKHNNHITKILFYVNEYALLCTTNRTLFKKNRLE